MTRRLDEHCLQRLCRRRQTAYYASGVACELQGLARWWLKDEVLRLAASEEPWRSQGGDWLVSRPRLPDAPGACWVLFALQRPDDWPLLRPALLLPLCWKRATDHSRQLPVALRRLAAEIVRELCPAAAGDSRWGLHLADCDGIDQWDLSGLHFACDSGKAPVAAGLICAMEGARPDPQVWATGTWGAGRDPLAVDHLEAKLQLAHQWGVREFFVPAGMEATAQAWCGRQASPLNIGRLDLAAVGPEPTAETVRKALNEYLSSLDVPPPVHAGDSVSDAVQAWYVRQSQRDRQRALKYYWETLLPVISRRCREQIQQAAARLGVNSACAWTHLVTIASDSPELVPLGARALQVTHCLILYSEDKKEMMEAARRGLAGSHCSVATRQFDARGNLSEQFRRAVGEFTAGVAPEKVVLDLTPGTKLMSFTLAYRVAHPGNWLHYLRHQIEKRTVCPGTEKPILWRSGASWDEGLVT